MRRVCCVLLLLPALVWALTACSGSDSDPDSLPGQEGQARRPSRIPTEVLAWTFDPETDLLSLHFDHAPDQDDGHSAAADRTLLQHRFGADWISTHVLVVSGAYGLNAGVFNPGSDAVMDAAWNDVGGWWPAHDQREVVIAEMVRRWEETLDAGGDIWVKEGGQSDLTAAVVAALRGRDPALDTTARIHVVQHSVWNEDQTSPDALAFTEANTKYIRIADANDYLNVVGGDPAFIQAALYHPVFGPIWTTAFAYYDPEYRLDFSDTGELLHILGLGRVGYDEFRRRYLEGG